MKEELIKLKNLRENMEQLKIKKQATYDKYLLDNDGLFKEIENTETLMTQAGEIIRNFALDQYAETGNKQLEFGVGIRVFKKLEYEEATAFIWAKEHGLALALDKRTFDKIARADPMDFIKINEIPQATIPFIIKIDGDQK